MLFITVGEAEGTICKNKDGSYRFCGCDDCVQSIRLALENIKDDAQMGRTAEQYDLDTLRALGVDTYDINTGAFTRLASVPAELVPATAR